MDIQNLNLNLPNGIPLLRNFSLTLFEGDGIHVYGPNGCGKSRLLSAIMNQWKYRSGLVDVFVRDDEIFHLPQMSQLNCHLPITLGEVVALRMGRRIEVSEMKSTKLGMSLDFSKRWNRASGGERQRTLLLSAFLQMPKLFILDEPFNHLDPDASELLASSLHSCLTRPSSPSAVLMVSHGDFSGGFFRKVEFPCLSP